jgi:hypothetical protein
VVFYSDLDSGPGSGGPSGGGAIVNVYGKGFGASQGSSFVSIGGAQALAYLQWSDTNVAFQLGGSAATGNLTVTTPNGTSNGVPFTVRAGNIYFVSTSGNDNNAGSYSAPWATLLHARDSMQPGDITYALNGVSQTTDDGSGWNACLTLDGSAGQSGTAGLPMAMVAYPGATATIGNVQMSSAGGCDSGIRAKGNGENYWTFAGFTIRAGFQAVNPYSETGWRIIANDLSCPNGNQEAGCADLQLLTTTKFDGNNVHNVGTNLAPSAVTAMYHGVYISGHNVGLDFGWNTIAYVQGGRGVQQHVNSGEGGDSYSLAIHDNVIHDTQCDGIIMDSFDPSQGTVALYNNVVYNAGTGPNNSDKTGDWSCMYLGGNGIGSDTATGSGAAQVYNNTMYACGTFANPPYSGSNAGFQWDPQGNKNESVNFVDNIVYLTTNVPYLLIYTTSEGLCSGNCAGVAGSNNLFYGNGAPPADSYLTATVNANPLFVSTTIPDFHLQAGSPAANGGATTPDVHDFDGVPLPQGSAYPIGAYAYPLGDPAGVSVSVVPGAVSLSANQSQQFTASVSGTGDSSVTWSMSPSAGSITAAGLFTAPASITSTQTVSVTATSAADTTKSASATVTLTPPAPASVAVTVSPSSVSLNAGQQQSFTATVTGSTNTTVTWSMTPSIGTLASSGVYTAPATISAQQTVTITATSAADTTKSASATVTLTPPPASVAVTVSPSSVSLKAGQQQSFTATVTGSTNTTVTWSMTPSIGTLASSGVYTAPATIAAQQTVTITATSAADTTKSASATVTLTPPPASTVSVSISPSSVTLKAGRQQSFTATVKGATNSGVKWSLSPAMGTISAKGMYTAPSSLTGVHYITVMATSVAQPSESGKALVTVNGSR